MKCVFCKNEIQNGVQDCPVCGGKVAPAPVNQIVMSDKSLVTYALLGFFLGNLGVHDFYLGKPGRAIFNIIGNFLVSPFLVQVSTGIELLTTRQDKEKRTLQGSPAVPTILGILLIILNLIIGGIVLVSVIVALAANA